MGIFRVQELKSYVSVPRGRRLFVYEDAACTTLATLTNLAGNPIGNPIRLAADGATVWGAYGGVAAFQSAKEVLWVKTDYPGDVPRPVFPNVAFPGAPASITFAPAAGGANVCEVTVTVRNAAGGAIAKPFILDLWLSDAATGEGLTAVTASGNVVAKASSGLVLQTVTAKKHLLIQTLETGVFILSITDSAKTGFYVCATLPTTGVPQVSAQLVTANYGS